MGLPIGSSLEIKQIATPAANPATGATLLYIKSDGLLYTKSPAGVETVVASTGGTGTATSFATLYKFGD